MNKSIIFNAFKWKFLERIFTQVIQFTLQIVLARLLSPDHYGQLSIMLVFTTLANTFIQSGFSSSLVQDKDVTDEDYDSVLWFSLLISVILYVLIFAFAPLICKFYSSTEMCKPFRILALMIFPGAINSVQQSKLSRELNYKKMFASSFLGMIISGIAGIAIAYNGGGLWALVFQSLLNVCITTVIMHLVIGWHIRVNCNLVRIKHLFQFGWKLLLASLLDALTQDLQSLIVGKKYATRSLGYYDKGKQFPQFLISSINSSVQTVMLSSLSRKQDRMHEVKESVKKTIIVSSYFVFPMCAGLAAVAKNLVVVLLSEKWSACVPYLQIYCVCFAFYPLFTCNLQAINAMGRSDIFLKLEVIKKLYGIGTIILAVVLFDSPIALALAGVVTTIPSFIVNAYPNKRLINYSPSEQFVDILPSLILSVCMALFIYVEGEFIIKSAVVVLVIQVITGVLIYLFASYIFKLDAFGYIWVYLGEIRRKNKND